MGLELPPVLSCLGSPFCSSLLGCQNPRQDHRMDAFGSTRALCLVCKNEMPVSGAWMPVWPKPLLLAAESACSVTHFIHLPASCGQHVWNLYLLLSHTSQSICHWASPMGCPLLCLAGTSPATSLPWLFSLGRGLWNLQNFVPLSPEQLSATQLTEKKNCNT